MSKPDIDRRREMVARKKAAGFVAVNVMLPPDLAKKVKADARLAWARHLQDELVAAPAKVDFG